MNKLIILILFFLILFGIIFYIQNKTQKENYYTYSQKIKTYGKPGNRPLAFITIPGTNSDIIQSNIKKYNLPIKIFKNNKGTKNLKQYDTILILREPMERFNDTFNKIKKKRKIDFKKSSDLADALFNKNNPNYKKALRTIKNIHEHKINNILLDEDKNFSPQSKWWNGNSAPTYILRYNNLKNDWHNLLNKRNLKSGNLKIQKEDPKILLNLNKNKDPFKKINYYHFSKNGKKFINKYYNKDIKLYKTLNGMQIKKKKFNIF